MDQKPTPDAEFRFDLEYAQALITGFTTWLRQIFMPGGNNKVEGTRLRFDFSPGQGFIHRLLVATNTLWLRKEVHIGHEDKRVAIHVASQEAMRAAYRSSKVEQALEAVGHRENFHLWAQDFVGQPSPLLQILRGGAWPHPWVLQQSQQLTEQLDVWYLAIISSFKAAPSQRGAELARLHAAGLIVSIGLGEAELLADESALATARIGDPHGMETKKFEDKVVISRASLALQNLQADRLLALINFYYRERHGGEPPHHTFTLLAPSLVRAMWWWYRLHLPGPVDRAAADIFPDAPDIWVKVRAPDAWPKFGQTLQRDFRGRPLEAGYMGPRIRLRVSAASDVLNVLNKDDGIARTLIWDHREKAEQFLDRMMHSRGLARSPIILAEEQGRKHPDLFIELVDEIRAWREQVLPVFRERCTPGQQEQGAEILASVLPGILLGLSFREAELRRTTEQLADRSRVWAKGERERFEAETDDIAHRFELLKEELAFFSELTSVWFWEWHYELLVRGSEISRYLPPRRRPPVEAEQPEDQPPADEPEPAQCEDDEGAAPAPQAGEPWAGIAYLEEIDLADPLTREVLLRNNKWGGFIKHLKPRYARRARGWFQANYLLFFVRTKSGKMFACLVSSEYGDADYWIRIDELGLWLQELALPLWKLRRREYARPYITIARYLALMPNDPGEVNIQVVHDDLEECMKRCLRLKEEG